MQKILKILLVIAAFGVFLPVSFVLFGYIVLSIPPFSHAVLPDYGTYIAVGLSVLLSLLVSLFLSWKVYRRLMKREQRNV